MAQNKNAKKIRLDVAMVERGLAPSREQAQRMVMAGNVLVFGNRAVKPSQSVAQDAPIELKGELCPYVSRGGLKLHKALEVFPIEVAGKVAADIGASTGGFTDCMLKHGARKVYAVDVGYGQLDYRLREHPDVVVMERTNARQLTPCSFSEPLEIATMDVSFISVRLILPALYDCLAAGAQLVVLIKPQFEAGREQVGKHGVVRDAAVHKRVLEQSIRNAQMLGYAILGLDYSPVTGPMGNIEFLLYLQKDTAQPSDIHHVAQETIDEIVDAAHEKLLREHA